MTRLPALLLVLLSLCVVAAACGDDDDAAPAAGGTGAATTESGAQFPVSIAHKYGTTEIAQAPKRIVTVGYNEQDTLFALGIAPVGVTDWMGFPDGIAPWTKDAAAKAGAKPELLKDTDGIQFEQIAALRPDVIIGLYTSMKGADYEKLSQIAPTVAPPKGTADWSIPWQDTTRIIGEIVGRPDEAAKLAASVDEHYANAKADHPEFQGKTATMAMSFDGMWAYGRTDTRSQMLQELGFELSPELTTAVGDQFSAKISDEKAALFDLDTVAWIGGEADKRKLDAKRVYTRLPVHQDGRDFFITMERPDRAMNAIGFQTVLSIPQALDVLVPAFGAALDDDPSTVPLAG